MNKVLKNVLIYLGVGALGAIIGIGALIGVSSCAYKQDNNNQEKAKAPRKDKKIEEFTSDMLGSEQLYYIVAKNYESNGNGVWYVDNQDTPTLARVYSAVMPQPLYMDIDSGGIGFEVIKNGNSFIKQLLYFETQSYDAGPSVGNVNKLSYVGLHTQGVSGFLDIYGSNPNSGYFRRENCAFTAKKLHISATGSIDRLLYAFNYLFDIYEIGNQIFSFTDNFNYYANYAQDIDTYFVSEPYFSDSTYLMKSVNVFSGVSFYSGGYVFDTIRFWYGNANGLYYNDNGVLKQWNSYGYATFEWVEYVNSATNLTIAVYQRTLTSEQGSNFSVMAYNLGGKWISEYYKEIRFFEDINDIEITKLSKFNNSSYSGGIGQYTPTNDIGLGNVFALLSQAFTAWVPIFAIQIVPGITIGLLLFLPLIAGVIVLIIWVVKR